jgi:glycosyltransferase 2 family protein
MERDCTLMTLTGDTPSVRWSSRMRAGSFTIAALLAAALLYYSLRGIEWRQVVRIVAGAAPGRLALAAGIATTTLFLRACRWRVLLNAEGTVSVSTAFWATAAGYFGNNFLPARAGELVRTLMISSRSGLETTYVLATALSERAADAVALVIISAVVLPILPAAPGWLADAARPLAILGSLAAMAIAFLPRFESAARAAIERAPLPHACRPRVIAVMEHGLHGMRAFHDMRRLSQFLALTAVIWTMDAFASVIVAKALGFAMPVPVAFLLMASLGLGSALPSTPGYVGIYQFVAVTVLTPFDFTRNDAIAYILVAQALAYTVVAIWGSAGLWRYRMMPRST